MVLAILLITAYFLFDGESTSLSAYNPVFWLEAIAFGISWLIKEEAMLRDEEESPA